MLSVSQRKDRQWKIARTRPLPLPAHSARSLAPFRTSHSMRTTRGARPRSRITERTNKVACKCQCVRACHQSCGCGLAKRPMSEGWACELLRLARSQLVASNQSLTNPFPWLGWSYFSGYFPLRDYDYGRGREYSFSRAVLIEMLLLHLDRQMSNKIHARPQREREREASIKESFNMSLSCLPSINSRSS